MPACSTPRFRGAIAYCLHSLPILSILLLFPGQSAHADPAPIPWRTQFEAAWGEAQARHRPLWVQFTGPWCIHCRRMEAFVFTQPEVIALSRDDFIPVKIRADERPDLAQRLAVSGLPATIILGPRGEYINRQDGYADAGRFLGFLFASRPPLESPERGAGEIALAGYDVVNLVSGHGLKAGQPDLSLRHDGLVFRFLNAADREAFEKDPDRYQPCYHGRCVVNLVDYGASVPGDPKFGVYYKRRLYLCADAAARQRFAADPDRYADADIADAGQCPHCRTEQNLLVRGQSQFSLIHQGRRYLFPDAGHLEAFRTSLEKMLR